MIITRHKSTLWMRVRSMKSKQCDLIRIIPCCYNSSRSYAVRKKCTAVSLDLLGSGFLMHGIVSSYDKEGDMRPTASWSNFNASSK